MNSNKAHVSPAIVEYSLYNSRFVIKDEYELEQNG